LPTSRSLNHPCAVALTALAGYLRRDQRPGCQQQSGKAVRHGSAGREKEGRHLADQRSAGTPAVLSPAKFSARSRTLTIAAVQAGAPQTMS